MQTSAIGVVVKHYGREGMNADAGTEIGKAVNVMFQFHGFST